MEVQSDRFGQNDRGRGGWEGAGLLECGLRSLGDNGLQGARFPQQQVPEGVSPWPCSGCRAEVVETAAWCSQPWWVGGAGLVWGVLMEKKDSSTCLLFPTADGRLWGLAPGGSGETHLGSLMAFR